MGLMAFVSLPPTDNHVLCVDIQLEIARLRNPMHQYESLDLKQTCKAMKSRFTSLKKKFGKKDR